MSATTTEGLYLEWKIGPDMYDQLPADVLDATGQPDEAKVTEALLRAQEAHRARLDEVCAMVATGSDEVAQRALDLFHDNRATRFLLGWGLPSDGVDRWLERIRKQAEKGWLPDPVLDEFMPRTDAEHITAYVTLRNGSGSPRNFDPQPVAVGIGWERVLDALDAVEIPEPDNVEQAASKIRALAEESEDGVYVTEEAFLGMFSDDLDCMRSALGPGYTVNPVERRVGFHGITVQRVA